MSNSSKGKGIGWLQKWIPPTGLLEDGFGWLRIAVPFVSLNNAGEEVLKYA